MNSKTSALTLREWRCSFRYRRNTIYRCNIDVENPGIEKTKPCPLVVRNPLYGSSQRLIFCLVLDFQGNMYMDYMGMIEEISTCVFFDILPADLNTLIFFVRTSMRYTRCIVYLSACLSCFFTSI